jgi:4,5:9,10-diseco-3-hydroxy-5,9,17-trioxoandrosta-1(10),2-diene-4-oate hydrolase
MKSATVETLRVAADGIDLHVTRAGTGTRPIVWLHGSGPGANGMSNFAQNLPAFADFDNLVFDLPRYGDSDRPVIEGPLAQYAAARLIAALDTLEIASATLVGNSFGGGVAALVAAAHPQRVARLVLMAPGGVRPPELRIPDDLPSGLKLLFGYMAQKPDRERMRALVREMLFDQALVTDELVERRYEASTRGAEIDMTRPPLNLGDVTPALVDVTCPTMLIWGREDRFIPLDWSRAWLDEVADAELHVLPRCGHWVQYERQADFDRLAGEFVRR